MDYDLLNRTTAIVIFILAVVTPPIMLYLSMMADTYSTKVGLKLGLIESNPHFSFFNEDGVTPEHTFHRNVTAMVLSFAFFIVNASVIYEALYGMRRYWWVLATLDMVFWFLALAELFTVFLNLHLLS